MTRPITLFTGQWADLPFEEVCRLASGARATGVRDLQPTKRALAAVDHRPAFGLNWDPSHMMWQDVDPVGFILEFADRIYHVDCKDTKIRVGDGRRGG